MHFLARHLELAGLIVGNTTPRNEQILYITVVASSPTYKKMKQQEGEDKSNCQGKLSRRCW